MHKHMHMSKHMQCLRRFAEGRAFCCCWAWQLMSHRASHPRPCRLPSKARLCLAARRAAHLRPQPFNKAVCLHHHAPISGWPACVPPHINRTVLRQLAGRSTLPPTCLRWKDGSRFWRRWEVQWLRLHVCVACLASLACLVGYGRGAPSCRCGKPSPDERPGGLQPLSVCGPLPIDISSNLGLF